MDCRKRPVLWSGSQFLIPSLPLESLSKITGKKKKKLQRQQRRHVELAGKARGHGFVQ